MMYVIKLVKRMMTSAFGTALKIPVRIRPMDMETALRNAVTHALNSGMYRSMNQFALAAGVDQASLFRFTEGGSLKLGSVSKIVDTLGGTLVFPWAATDADRLKLENDKLLADLSAARDTITGLKAQVEILKELVGNRAPQTEVSPPTASVSPGDDTSALAG